MNADISNRIEKGLKRAQELAPELRFGQLVAIVGELAADETGASLWDLEDQDFAAAVDRFLKDLSRRSSADAPSDRGTAPEPSEFASLQSPRPLS